MLILVIIIAVVLVVGLIALLTMKYRRRKTLDNFTNNIRVKLDSWFAESKTLCDIWKKMTPNNSLKMQVKNRTVEFVDSEPCDYYLVIHKNSDGSLPPPEKTLTFQMETWLEIDHDLPYLYNGAYKFAPHVVEWHLSTELNNLLAMTPEKTEGDAVSCILSDKDSNHMYKHRIDFAHHLDGLVNLHKYGSDKGGWKNYKGTLPAYTKDSALFPYKYTFNAENSVTHNYVTEKLYDAILSECLIFYMGAPNASEIIDPRAFIQLPVDDMDTASNIVINAIANNEYHSRLPYIQAEKRRLITTETPFAIVVEKLSAII